jgi:hypothetical protein
MLSRSKSLPATLAALAILLVAVGGASAGRLSLNNNTFRVVWSPMRFITRAGTEITCNVTFEGSFASRTFTKSFGSQIASITAARLESCSRTMVLLTETLPWSLFYSSFIGTLPRIEQLVTLLTGMRFRWGAISTCLYRVVAEAPQQINFVRRMETGQLILANLIQSWITSESLGCTAEDMRLSGTGSITTNGGFEGLFLSLI